MCCLKMHVGDCISPSVHEESLFSLSVSSQNTFASHQARRSDITADLLGVFSGTEPHVVVKRVGECEASLVWTVSDMRRGSRVYGHFQVHLTED